MRVLVRNGHFAFYPGRRDEIIRFKRLTKMDLVREGDYFTFEALAGLPTWSQTGRLFGTLPALETYAGDAAWQVMGKNGFVFSLTLGTLVPLASIVAPMTLTQSRDYVVSPYMLIQPGLTVSVAAEVGIMVGYSGEIDLEMQRLYLYDWENLADA